MNAKSIFSLAFVIFFLTGGMLSGPSNADERIAKVAGKTYGQWSAKWWQWAFDNGFPDQGAFGDGIVDCAMGQSGPVWFIAGRGAESCCEDPGGDADRMCADTIPPGKHLFFPLINTALINPDSFCPPDPLDNDPTDCTVQEKREITDAIFNDIMPGPVNSRTCFLSASVDGIPVIFKDIPIVRTQSPTFLLASDPETIADGYWVMLPPLSKGEHRIFFSGAICLFDGNTDPMNILFGSRVTYELTVR